MASQIRVCPNCGASVIGNTTYCPRCDFPLPPATQTAQPDHDEAAIAEDRIPTAKAMPPLKTEPMLDKSAVDALEAATQAEEIPAPPPIDPALLATDKKQPTQKTDPHERNFENARTAPINASLIGASAPSLEATQPQTPPPQPPLNLDQTPQWRLPPAPYTPPPLREATKSVNPYSFPSNYYLEQRVNAYRQGGYEVVNFTPYQVTLAQGKGLSLFWWLVAMLSGIGLFWYFIILLTSGFSKDRVYLIVERDGTLYEDGAGAAHVRRQRAKVGRRWGFLGVAIFFVALIWFVIMIGAAVYGVENYRAELEAAYPEVSIFSSNPGANNPELDQDAVATAESAVLAYSVLFVVCLVSLLTGLTLTIVGYLHSTAYDVEVVPLPVYK